jgi:hypothetical protein
LQRIALGNNLKARGSVEAWLSSVEQEMQRSLARLAKDGYKSYNAEPRTEWILQQPAQVLLPLLLAFLALLDVWWTSLSKPVPHTA